MVVMAGFALAFHAVFFSCDVTSSLGDSFGTFASALLFVFEAPLGEFSFEIFDDVGVQCPDHASPGQASDAGIFLLVVSTSLSLVFECGFGMLYSVQMVANVATLFWDGWYHT